MTVEETLHELEELGLEAKRIETDGLFCQVWFYDNNFKLYASPNGINVQCRERGMTQLFSWPNDFRVYDDCDGLACHITLERGSVLHHHSHLKDLKRILSINLSEI